MDIIVIGGSGHWHIAAEAANLDSSLHITGIAPGRQDEDISSLKSTCDAPAYEDWHKLLDSTNADMAVVNPWFCDATEISIACLKKGMHVYSEKPLSTTHEGLAELENAYHASGKSLGGMFNYRFYPWFMAMRSAVENDEIGEIRQMHAQKSYRMGIRPDFYKRREDMGGIIPWVAIHAIDWVMAFGGDCRWVSATHSRRENRGNGDMETTSAILLGLENERIATVTADFLRPTGSARHDDDRLRLTGTRGMLEVIDGRVYLENEAHRREIALPPMKNALLEFINAIVSGKAGTFAQSALNATRVSLYARDSADSDGIRTCIK